MPAKSFLNLKMCIRDRLYNSCPVINRAGEVICTYDKNHLYSYNGDTENRYITTGSNPVMAELEGVKMCIRDRGNIETAQNDVTFSKINQLAQAFELSLSEFLNF